MHALAALGSAAMASRDDSDLAIDCCALVIRLTGGRPLRIITDMYDTATLLLGKPAPAEPIDYLPWVETRVVELEDEDDDAAEATV